MAAGLILNANIVLINKNAEQRSANKTFVNKNPAYMY